MENEIYFDADEVLAKIREYCIATDEEIEMARFICDDDDAVMYILQKNTKYATVEDFMAQVEQWDMEDDISLWREE